MKLEVSNPGNKTIFFILELESYIFWNVRSFFVIFSCFEPGNPIYNYFLLLFKLIQIVSLGQLWKDSMIKCDDMQIWCEFSNKSSFSIETLEWVGNVLLLILIKTFLESALKLCGDKISVLQICPMWRI